MSGCYSISDIVPWTPSHCFEFLWTSLQKRNQFTTWLLLNEDASWNKQLVIGRLYGADNRPKHYRCTSKNNINLWTEQRRHHAWLQPVEAQAGSICPQLDHRLPRNLYSSTHHIHQPQWSVHPPVHTRRPANDQHWAVLLDATSACQHRSTHIVTGHCSHSSRRSRTGWLQMQPHLAPATVQLSTRINSKLSLCLPPTWISQKSITLLQRCNHITQRCQLTICSEIESSECFATKVGPMVLYYIGNNFTNRPPLTMNNSTMM